MIRFLLKGLLRDRSSSLFPVVVVAAGVALTVFLNAWINGVVSSVIQSTAHYKTGHLSIMTRAYASKAEQNPNDLALLGVDTLLREVRRSSPDLFWTPRITFGGLLDIPDEHGETQEQAPVSGLGVDLLSKESPEWSVLSIGPSLARGHLPAQAGEILIADDLAIRLGLAPGQKATLISSTMYGSMAFANVTVAGTVRFGIGPLDHSSIIADIEDVRRMLDMTDGASAILGLFRNDLNNEERATAVSADFNAVHAASEGKFVPTMITLRKASGLSDYMDLVETSSRLILAVFLLAMSIVLWNAGLTGSLRRYGELGLRLAVGEDQGHVYRSLIAESLMIGVAGSLAGTVIGVGFAYYLQVHGFDIGAMTRGRTMMVTDIVRAQVTPLTYVIGFIPGVLATLLGSAVSGLGIYKRQTSQLFKELET